MCRMLLCLVLLALGVPASAVTITEPANYVPLGYCQLSVTAAVQISTCSSGIPALATFATMQVETQAIRWRDDGTAPTTTVGFPLAVNTMFVYSGGQLANLQVVAQASTAVVNIVWYRY